MSEKITTNNNCKFPTRIQFLNVSGLFNLREMLQDCLHNFLGTNECKESNSFQFGNTAGSLDSLVDLMCSRNADLAMHSFTNISLPETPSHALKSVSISVLDFYAWAMPIIDCIANIITVVMILRTPPHGLFYVQRGFFLSEMCKFFRTFYKLEILRYSNKLNSSLNVILLSLVKFLTFVHPIRSRVFLTNPKIVLAACSCSF